MPPTSDPTQVPLSRRWRIKPLGVTGWEGVIVPTRERLTIGRSAENDVVLDGEVYPSVSSHHTLIEFVNGELWLEDLGSRNGTYLNGEPVDRSPLSLGAQIQLGSIGPRFAVVSSEPLSQTLFVDPKSVQAAIGSVSKGQVERMVKRRARRTFIRIAVLSSVLVGLLGWWARNALRVSSDEMSASLEAASAEGRQRADKMADELRVARGVIAQLQELGTSREREQMQREREREELTRALQLRVDERESAALTLAERLGMLEGDDEQEGEIERLSVRIEETQAELREARAQLTALNPVNLEQARLAGVSHVRKTVVLLEVEMALVSSETSEQLYLSRQGEPNFEGRGRPWVMGSSGSGFCVSEGGWILTNAHVVSPGKGSLLGLAGDLPITTQTTIHAVFSGTQERYSARLVQVAEDGIDLALVHIQPFEGMPHLKEFTLGSPAPQAGGDIYLLGFPLGNFALQEGRTVIASTFRGILSRIVDGSLQVDAGVHPGNSGGPITDPLGNVIGVVSSLQATPERTAIYTIGYGIPIADAASIWPPPEDLQETTPDIAVPTGDDS